jgi:uncharacterized protein (TIGR02246 family)
MAKWMICLVTMLVTAPARADLNSEIRAHEDAFARACEGGNVDAVLALYTDDAIVVWPGAGEEGKGKAAIEKLATAFCKGSRNLKLTLKSLDVVPLDDTHAATVGHWDGSSTGPGGKRTTTAIRATEVLVKSDGGWRYMIDHASAGMAPPRPVVTKRPPRRER